MRKKQQFIATAAAVSVASLMSASAFAASITFTGAASSTGTTLVWPYPKAITLANTSNVTYYSLDTSTSNWTGGTGNVYTAGDDVTFNKSSGTFLLATQSNFTSTSAPASMTFSGGNSSTVYVFLRASTTAGRALRTTSCPSSPASARMVSATATTALRMRMARRRRAMASAIRRWMTRL